MEKGFLKLFRQILYQESSWIRKGLCRIFSSQVFYINGPTQLPPPLSHEMEAELVGRLQTGDEQARQELIEHNLRLVVYIARKFENTNIYVEDLISIGTIGLIKAVNTFCPGKNIKLATYASRCIENEILMYLRKNTNTRSEISIEEPLNIDWDGNELLLSDVLGSNSDEIAKNLEKEDEIEFLNRAIAELSDRDRQIMCLRYGLDQQREYTQKEVADLLGISQSYISRLEKKILTRLRKDLESLV